MKENVLLKSKKGMLVLVSTILVYIVAIIGLIIGLNKDIGILMGLCMLWIATGWVLFLGLRVLGPQEALVFVDINFDNPY